jgi:hypothetical protein
MRELPVKRTYIDLVATFLEHFQSELGVAAVAILSILASRCVVMAGSFEFDEDPFVRIFWVAILGPNQHISRLVDFRNHKLQLNRIFIDSLAEELVDEVAGLAVDEMLVLPLKVKNTLCPLLEAMRTILDLLL